MVAVLQPKLLIDTVEPDIIWVSNVKFDKESTVLKSRWVEG